MNELVDKNILSKFIDKLTTGQVKGKGLSSNDFTDELKNKLSDITNFDPDIIFNNGLNALIELYETGISNEEVTPESIEDTKTYYNSLDIYDKI